MLFVGLLVTGRRRRPKPTILTNIGTLFAFILVCLGVLVLRHTDPDRPRPFRVPFVWPVTLWAPPCFYVMQGLPMISWYRFGIWLVIVMVIYIFGGYRHSTRGSGTGLAGTT